jgi:formate dehydrogenase (NADP+) beta subunit
MMKKQHPIEKGNQQNKSLPGRSAFPLLSTWGGKFTDQRTTNTIPLKEAIPEKFKDLPFKGLMAWNGIVVRDGDTDIPSLTYAYLREARKISCGECSVCMIGIDRVMEIFRKFIEGEGNPQDLKEIEEIAHEVSVNGKCNFGRSAALVPVADAIRYFKGDFLALIKGDKSLFNHGYETAVTAPCIEACPAGLPITAYIEKIKNFQFGESLALIRSKCILPGVVGRACTHPCEAVCVRQKVDAPVAIRLLKRAVSDQDLKDGCQSLALPKAKKKEKVCIIGAGPSGLAAAYHLRLMGYPVTIFDGLSVMGGMAAVGIPDYRLPKEVLSHETNLIKRMGVDVFLNRRVELLKWDDLKKKGFKALFLAIGAHRGADIGLAGENDLVEGFVQGIDFLREIQERCSDIKPVKKVFILGGGNVAMDCARSCLRLGFGHVEILYRRSRAEMPALPEEIEEALKEGVKIRYLTAPLKVNSKWGRIEGLECVKMKLGERDDSGRRKPIPIEGSNFTLKADMVIAAVGQEIDTSFLTERDRKVLSQGNKIWVDPISCRTDKEGVFAGGDCVTGPATLIEALDMGNRAARSIDAYLQGKEYHEKRVFAGIDTASQRGDGFYPTRQAVHVSLASGDDTLNDFAEVERGFTQNEAMEEARRCLRCYRLMVWEVDKSRQEETQGGGK